MAIPMKVKLNQISMTDFVSNIDLSFTRSISITENYRKYVVQGDCSNGCQGKMFICAFLRTGSHSCTFI